MSFAELAISPACCSTAAGGTPCLGHYAAGRLRSRGDPLAGGPEMLTWVVDRVGLAADLLAEARRAYSGGAGGSGAAATKRCRSTLTCL